MILEAISRQFMKPFNQRGADLTEADQSQIEIENAIRPKRSRKGAQGFGLNSSEKEQLSEGSYESSE